MNQWCERVEDALRSREEQLHGYYLTEDEGHLLNIYPGSERLRYLIPFGQVHETIEYLGGIGHQHANAVVVFGDDYADKNSTLMSPAHFRQFILPGLKRCVDAAHDAGSSFL